MMKLNKLEEAILDAIAAREVENSDALKLQVRDLVVLGRKNSGGGFFTYVRPIRREKVITKRAIGNVFAKIAGLNNPMTFVLFSDEHGYIKTLEGASTVDDTTSIDFSNVRFDICQDW
jgi:hypothetical protein